MNTEVATRLHFDHGDLHVETVQDVGDILDRNAMLRSMTQVSDWGRHIASIPDVIQLRWLNEENARGNCVRLHSKEFNEIVARKLRDPEWKYLRTDK